MQKYISIALFIFFTYWTNAQNVAGSWVLVAEEETHQLSIDETANRIELQLYDESFNLTGEKTNVNIAEIVQEETYKIYVAKVPDEDEYLSFYFFEAEDKENIKLYVAKDFISIEEAKSFEKPSNLGLFLYRIKKYETIQSFRPLRKIRKFELKAVFEKLLSTLKTEMKKHEDLGDEVELYIMSELYHYFILERYNPYDSLDGMASYLENDEELQDLFEEISELIDEAEN